MIENQLKDLQAFIELASQIAKREEEISRQFGSSRYVVDDDWRNGYHLGWYDALCLVVESLDGILNTKG